MAIDSRDRWMQLLTSHQEASFPSTATQRIDVFVKFPSEEVCKFNFANNDTIRPIYDLMSKYGLSLLDHKLILENPHCELEISRSTATMTLYELNIRPNEVLYIEPV